MPAWDEARLAKLRQRSLPRQGTWEVDFSYIPATIGERGQRPYVPLSLMCVDSASGFILTTHIAQRDKHLTEFQTALLQILEQAQWLPGEFRVKRLEIRDWLMPLAAALGIQGGEEVSWELLERKELHLVRKSPAPLKAKRRA